MSDEAIIDQIVELLISSRLHVHALFEKAPPRGTSGEIASKAAPFPLAERTPRSEGYERAPIKEPPTFSDIDAAAQADTLVAAAAEGKPFCPE
jgi:hypothetical protein